MTIENSEDTAQVGAIDPAAEPVLEPPSDLAESARDGSAPADAASAAVIDTAQLTLHDSTPPLSRKLAPPPKPKRESGMASSPPSARPAGEVPDLLASSSALKAPIAPTISYAGDGAAKAEPVPEVPEPPVLVASGAAAPLSQPPPIPRRRSNPSFALDDAEGTASASARPPSDPTLSLGEPRPVSNAPRPLATPPRPRSEPPPPRPRSESDAVVAAAAVAPVVAPPESSGPVSSAPLSAPPSSSSAIFAMRIIAVGDSVRPPPVSEHVAEIEPGSYPPSASRLGTGVRRSSRPAMAAVSVPEAPAPAPSAPHVEALAIDVDVPIDVEPPIHALAPAGDTGLFGEEPPSVVQMPPAPPAEPRAVEMRPPPPPPPVELEPVPPSAVVSAGDVAEKKAAHDADAEELGREDAISMQPEEVAALQAELQAKADAAKPPPPPKRAAGMPASAPPLVEPTASAPKEPPPTPDLAAAKAAQRSKTRQPWWEDLFNEDFMRANSRVSDEQIRREVTFIEESLGVAAGGVVLDLGCGSGHHAVEFASRGYGVVGYDLSLYQLALAADVAQERSQKINFLQGDMREMAFEEMFDGVFCWNTTFGYFEEDKNLAVAQRVFKALRPGGMFLIDVLNRDFAAASAPCSVWYEGDSCVCMDDMSVDYISSRLRVKRSIILDDGRTKESLYSLRLYSLHELGKLLHEVGFRVTEASGHPSTPGVFFGPNSPRIIMLAQRP